MVTLPALKGDANGAPYAFTAVTSITVIGLYIAYVIPVYLRWRKGDSWQAGPWSLGKKYKWVNPIAVIWVAICVVMFSLPGSPKAVPWNDKTSTLRRSTTRRSPWSSCSAPWASGGS